MVIKEMTMHLASPEAAFQATSSDECLRELYTWQSRSALIRSITFREVVESFCRSSITGATQQCFADLGPLNLFAVVSGMCTELRDLVWILIVTPSLPCADIPAPKLVWWK
jgi:hypothetical protein